MPILDFAPLVQETAQTIRARLDADVNAGIDPNDPAFIDTTEGTVYWDLTQGVVLEMERLWDFAATEVPAAMFPPTAWGPYLDLHGEILDVLRKDSVRATGYVSFTGDPDSPIPTGTVVGTVTTSPDEDPIEFRTTQPTTLASSPGPAALAATAPGTGGTLPAGTKYYEVSALVPRDPAWNLLSTNEASIETDATGWTNITNVTVARSTAQARDGAASLSMTATGAADMAAALAADKVAVPGEVWTANAWFRAATTAKSVRVSLEFRDAGNTVMGTLDGSTVVDGTTGWVKAEVAGTAPVGTTKVRIKLWVLTAAASGVHYVDGVRLGKGVDLGEAETVVSNEVGITTSGSTSAVVLTWAPFAGASGYRVYKGTISTQEKLLTTIGVQATFTDTGALSTGAQDPLTNAAPVEALEPGHHGNVAAGTVTLLLSAVEGVTTVSNVLPITGGADVENDDLYRDRILLEYLKPPGAGNIGDYERWSRAYEGVGFATIDPLWNGAGTVRSIVTDEDNNPSSAATVAGLQAQLDPVSQQGHGKAPIGAAVTIATPALVTVNVNATLTLITGYSLDGTAGTIPVRSDVNTALREYIDSLKPGDDVILEHAKSRVFAVDGVYDVSGFQLNGAGSNVPIGPPGAIQVAALGTVTLA